MFGYINVCKEQLRVYDYELFRAYYCGVCKAMGKHYSHISRLGLSYDIVFLAILLSAIDDEKADIKKSRCITHPLTARLVVVNDAAVEYAASVGIILSFLKLCDDACDDKSVKALAAIPFLYFPYKKAAAKYKNVSANIKEQLKLLSAEEKRGCGEIDKVSDIFAKLLCKITADYKIPKGEERQISWLLYNVGKWIYMIDALDDIDTDFKKKNYNPFLIGMGDEVSFEEYKRNLCTKMDVVFGMTLQSIAQSYELLTVYKCDEILRNIIFLGMNMKTKSILEDKNESI